jgi:hypothetical protein
LGCCASHSGYIVYLAEVDWYVNTTMKIMI